LTEETEFGIALTTCLRVLSREMTRIQEWLKAGDASATTVTLEIRVEQDLLGLLEAMRRLPPTTPPPPGTPLPTEPRARERELNRLIAELKMIRLLQVRLDDDTVLVDGERPKSSVLTPALKREIEALKASQEEIRDSLAKIAAQLEGEDDAGAAVVPEPVDR
jgi:septal ring factor EnvC (AmiA/AmiB activator)